MEKESSAQNTEHFCAGKNAHCFTYSSLSLFHFTDYYLHLKDEKAIHPKSHTSVFDPEAPHLPPKAADLDSRKPLSTQGRNEAEWL